MGIFSKLFGKPQLASTPADLSMLGADMHSHFIPGIDDGAKTIEDSVAMITALYNMGYKKVVTTPHIMGDFYRNTPEIILGGLEKVRAALKNAGVPIQVEAAAEYYLDFDFERKLDQEKLLTFGDKYVLFEISYMNPPDNLGNIIFKLQTAGYKPVLAHPERYPYWKNEFERFEQIKDKGCLLQMNINSLTGYYSHDTKRLAEMMIEKGMVDFVGTDCHHIGHIELIKKVVYEKPLHKLLQSGRLLNGTI